jgi:hypothetical protein
MIRILKQGSKYFGLPVVLDEDEIENITRFAAEGFPVIIVNDLEDLDDLDKDDIEMIDPDEGGD